MTAAGSEPDRTTRDRPPRLALLALVNLAALLVVAGLVALGIWQVQRRAWKHDLIARVEARVRAPPVPPPGPADWPRLAAETDAYRRLRLTGAFAPEPATLVQAVTALGAGFWVLAPFRTAEGFTVLVNRGFVGGPRDPARWPAPEGPAALTGLLRVSEPGGAFLRANDPASDRWTSRDVAAITRARGLADAAPYFVDAEGERTGERTGGEAPVGGLTVVAFSDNHLVYAITWFVLAGMTVAAVAYLDRDAVRRLRTDRSHTAPD